MGIYEQSNRRMQCRVISADLTAALRELTDHGIILHDIYYENDLEAELTIRCKDKKTVQRLLRKRGDSCKSHAQSGGLHNQIKNRYFLIFGILVLLILTIFIPSRIFFVQVSGNQNLPDRYILEKAMENGLSFGCDRRAIRSSQLKNQMLEQIPELDWVGITTAGCVATVEVKEKQIPKQVPEKNFGSIVSAADGIVETVTVTRGRALCAPGQAVCAGQVLISGYVDQGLLIKATGAEGEVFAKTYRKSEAVTPARFEYRGERVSADTCYSIQIGKKVINFSKYSSISQDSCGKMYSKKYVTLPGGYRLPIALIREERITYETYEGRADDFSWLAASSRAYLHQQMLAGKILEEKTDIQADDTVGVLTGSYLCTEQIGKYRFEENPLDDGQNS